MPGGRREEEMREEGRETGREEKEPGPTVSSVKQRQRETYADMEMTRLEKHTHAYTLIQQNKKSYSNLQTYNWCCNTDEAPNDIFMLLQHMLQTLQHLRNLKISKPDMQEAHVHTHQRSCGGAEDTAGLAAWGSQQKVSRDKAVWLWLHVGENLHTTTV